MIYNISQIPTTDRPNRSDMTYYCNVNRSMIVITVLPLLKVI